MGFFLIFAIGYFDFARVFYFVFGSVNFNSQGYYTQLHTKADRLEKPVVFFISPIIVFLWVCVYPQIVSSSPVCHL